MSRRGRHSAGDDWPPDDDPLVELMREAMHRRVDSYHPAGDGLQRIQGRVARRQRWTTFRPALAAVALAGVIALIAVGATLVPGSGDSGTTLADEDSSTATSVAKSSGPGGPGGEPLLMMWPYPNAAKAAEHGAAGPSGDLPDLSDPVATAQSFIDSVFPGAGMTAGVPVAHEGTGTIGVPVEAPAGPVGEVQLRPVPTDDGDLVHGVISVTTHPSGDPLVLAEVTKPDDGLVPIEGTLSTDLGPVATSVNVALYAGGQSTPTAESDADVAPGGKTWSTELQVPDTVTAGFVLAWAEDPAGTPLAVAAVPIGSGQSSSPPPPEETSDPPSSGPGSSSSGPGSSSADGGSSSPGPPVPVPPSSPGDSGGSTPPTSPTTPPSTPPTTEPTPPVSPTTPPSSEPTTPPSTETPPTAPPSQPGQSGSDPAIDQPAT